MRDDQVVGHLKLPHRAKNTKYATVQVWDWMPETVLEFDCTIHDLIKDRL